MAKLNASIAYTSNAAAKPGYGNVPMPVPDLEASVLVEIEWVYMTLRSGKRKHAPTIAKEAAWGDPPSPVEEEPPPAPFVWPPVQFGIQELFVDDEMEVDRR